MANLDTAVSNYGEPTYDGPTGQGNGSFIETDSQEYNKDKLGLTHPNLHRRIETDKYMNIKNYIGNSSNPNIIWKLQLNSPMISIFNLPRPKNHSNDKSTITFTVKYKKLDYKKLDGTEFDQFDQFDYVACFISVNDEELAQIEGTQVDDSPERTYVFNIGNIQSTFNVHINFVSIIGDTTAIDIDISDIYINTTTESGEVIDETLVDWHTSNKYICKGIPTCSPITNVGIHGVNSYRTVQTFEHNEGSEYSEAP